VEKKIPDVGASHILRERGGRSYQASREEGWKKGGVLKRLLGLRKNILARRNILNSSLKIKSGDFRPVVRSSRGEEGVSGRREYDRREFGGKLHHRK